MQVIHDVRDDMRTRMPDRGPLDALHRSLPARRRRGERRGQAAHRRPHHRGRAVGLHHLRRLPGGLPGLHRPPREDHPDAAEPGAGAGEGPDGSGAHLHQPRAQRQPLGHRRRQAHGLGRGPGRPDAGRSSPTPNTCCGSAARAPTTIGSRSRRGARRGHARGRRRLRGAGPGRGLHRRSGAALGQRDAVPDGGAAEHRD